MQQPVNRHERGFTLIELSIVLVIIGFLAGGVLVGQDLIKAAEIRAVVSQYEKYNSAVNTFRGKYNGLPGDMPRASAVAFGLCPTAGCPTIDAKGLGDNDGRINDTIAAGNTNQPDGEILAFWLQLSMANLVDGAFGHELTNTYAVGANATKEKYFPTSKIGAEPSWIVGTDNGTFNYFSLTRYATFATGSYTINGSAITPIEARNIDLKLDDGKPYGGNIQARQPVIPMTPYFGALTPATAAPFGPDISLGAVTVGACTTGASATDKNNNYMLYNGLDAPAGSTRACSLILRMM